MSYVGTQNSDNDEQDAQCVKAGRDVAEAWEASSVPLLPLL